MYFTTVFLLCGWLNRLHKATKGRGNADPLSVIRAFGGSLSHFCSKLYHLFMGAGPLRSLFRLRCASSDTGNMVPAIGGETPTLPPCFELCAVPRLPFFQNLYHLFVRVGLFQSLFCLRCRRPSIGSIRMCKHTTEGVGKDCCHKGVQILKWCQSQVYIEMINVPNSK